LSQLFNKETAPDKKMLFRNQIFLKIIETYQRKNKLPLEHKIDNPGEIIFEALNQFIDKMILPYLANYMAILMTEKYHHEPLSVIEFFNAGFELIKENSINKATIKTLDGQTSNNTDTKVFDIPVIDKTSRTQSQGNITRTKFLFSKPPSDPSCNKSANPNEDGQNSSKGSKIKTSSFPFTNKQLKDTQEKPIQMQARNIDNLSDSKETSKHYSNAETLLQVELPKITKRKNTKFGFDTLTKFKPSYPTTTFQAKQEASAAESLPRSTVHYDPNS
jgi:hypothetical protein